MHFQHKTNGFHLIEILIVLALTSIMSHWMLNSYASIIAKERRREAVHALYSLASALEGYALEHASYAGATLRQLKLPTRVADGNYELVINFARQNEFQISAHPLARQAEIDTRCGILLLTSTGEKNITGAGTHKECW